MHAYDWFLLALFYFGVGNSLTARWWLRAQHLIAHHGRLPKTVAYLSLVVTWPFYVGK